MLQGFGHESRGSVSRRERERLRNLMGVKSRAVEIEGGRGEGISGIE